MIDGQTSAVLFGRPIADGATATLFSEERVVLLGRDAIPSPQRVDADLRQEDVATVQFLPALPLLRTVIPGSRLGVDLVTVRILVATPDGGRALRMIQMPLSGLLVAMFAVACTVTATTA